MATIKMAIGKIEVMAKSFQCARHYHLTQFASVSLKNPQNIALAALHPPQPKTVFITGAFFYARDMGQCFLNDNFLNYKFIQRLAKNY